MRHGISHLILAAAATVLFCIMIHTSAIADGTNGFSVTRVGQIVCYGDNAFEIYAPEAGELTITIRNDTSVFRTLQEQIEAGKSRITWDGLGYNQERLYQMTYHIAAKLTGESGNEYEAVFDSPIEHCAMALMFALPSGATAYQDRPEEWFIECKCTMGGTLVIAFYADGAEDGTAAYSFEREIPSGRVSRLTLERIQGKNRIESGEYKVRVWEKTAPKYSSEFSVAVMNESPEMPEVGVTGAIMPEADATDTEIWEKMIAPAIVVNIRNHDHQNVYAEPDAKSEVLGTLHGQTQALEVTEIEGEWAKVKAWNHESADLIEGYVPLEKLKVKYPQTEYGLLLDKAQQTLTVFRQGERIGTILVCTGRMQKRALYQETSAGSFLTGDHRVDYSMYGNKYDYVIQYDGGNLIHQIPYAFGTGKKDFRNGRALLGTKGSHACIRVQAEPGEGSGINSYWIWTHIPHDTRVIITDDPEARLEYRSILDGSAAQGTYIRSLTDPAEIPADDQDTVVISFGGNTIPGTQEGGFSREDSFIACVEANGYEYPLAGVREILEADDISCVNLECVLKADRTGEDINQAVRYRGLPDFSRILKEGSVEVVSLANHHTMDYGEAGYTETIRALDEQRISWCGTEQPAVVEIKGHRIGFCGFTEKAYITDPQLIQRDMERLRQAGCDFIICQCHWGEEKDEYHNNIQEAIARACVRNGAGLVIGHHPQRVQGISYINGVPVIYSLGDLCNGAAKGWCEGVIARAYVSFSKEKPEVSLQLIPVASGEKKGKNDYHPVPAEGTRKEDIIHSIQADTGIQ